MQRDLGLGWRESQPVANDRSWNWNWILRIILVIGAVLLAGCIDDPGALARGWMP